MLIDDPVTDVGRQLVERERREPRPGAHPETLAVGAFSEEDSRFGIVQSLYESGGKLFRARRGAFLSEPRESLPPQNPCCVHENVGGVESAIGYDPPIVELAALVERSKREEPNFGMTAPPEWL